MILAIDVQYDNDRAVAAGVMFETWSDQSPIQEYTSLCDDIADYEPGSFYKRELPCILKLLQDHDLKPHTIVIDGFVYLDSSNKAGLGKHLYTSINETIEIVGVAKSKYPSVSSEWEVFRGDSKKPLYVTTTSTDLDSVKELVLNMDGKYRIPTLLKRADQLCREKVAFL
jgi:deoxyribonuclease V